MVKTCSLSNLLDEESIKEISEAYTLVHNFYVCFYQRSQIYNEIHFHNKNYFKNKVENLEELNCFNLSYNGLNKKSLKGMMNEEKNFGIYSSLVLQASIIGVLYPIIQILNNCKIFKFFRDTCFDGNENDFKKFDRLIRVIRNTFVHNISSDIKIRSKDYIAEKDTIFKESDNNQAEFKFTFDYSKHPFCKEMKTVDILIKRESIKDGANYTDIISREQNQEILNLCYILMEEIWKIVSLNNRY